MCLEMYMHNTTTCEFLFTASQHPTPHCASTLLLWEVLQTHPCPTLGAPSTMLSLPPVLDSITINNVFNWLALSKCMSPYYIVMFLGQVQ